MADDRTPRRASSAFNEREWRRLAQVRQVAVAEFAPVYQYGSSIQPVTHVQKSPDLWTCGEHDNHWTPADAWECVVKQIADELERTAIPKVYNAYPPWISPFQRWVHAIMAGANVSAPELQGTDA